MGALVYRPAVADYRPPLNDISFVLDHLVDLDEICQLEPFAHLDRDTIKAVLEENARFVGDVIAPLNRIGDEQGSQHQADNSVKTPDGFIDAYQAYVDGGWGAVPFEPVYGGGGFPWLVGIVMQEFISSANMAFSMCPLLTQGAIDMLRHHGSEEQKEIYLPKMVSGEWTGSMNLTEPEAGSDVGALRTKAVPADDGTWRITGTKIFISFGEHDMADNIVHLVLARTPGAPPGTKGISCFIVPKFLVDDDGSHRRAQRRHVRLDRAQDGHQGQPHLRDELRRAGRRRRLPHRRGEPGHALHVHDDEQRPALGGARGPGPGRAGLPGRAAVRPGAPAGHGAGRPGRRGIDDHRPPRRAPHAAHHEGARSRPCAA